MNSAIVCGMSEKLELNQIRRQENERPVATEGKLLRDAFLSSNIVFLLARMLKALGGETYQIEDSDHQLVAEGIKFLGSLDIALQFISEPEKHLISPSSEAIETVDDLIGPRVALNAAQVKDFLDTSLEVLKSIEETRSSDGKSPAAIQDAQVFFRTIHSAVLQRLEGYSAPGIRVKP